MIDFSYYLITDRKQCALGSLKEQVEQACKAGLRAVQLREKDMKDRELLKLADALREITRKYDTLLFINDRTDIAMMAGADGVHSPETGLTAEEIKKLDSRLMVGSSVHSLEAAKKAEKNEADFVLFGPIFDTPSKRQYGHPKGLVALQEVQEYMKIPLFAVGGINPENAERCMEYEADGLAGISSVMSAENPAEVLEKYKKILGNL